MSESTGMVKMLYEDAAGHPRDQWWQCPGARKAKSAATSNRAKPEKEQKEAAATRVRSALASTA